MTNWKTLPLIPRDEKKSVKIKTKDIEIIKELFDVKKLTMVAIAKLYSVHSITIKRILNPEFRKRNQLVTSRWQKINVKKISILVYSVDTLLFSYQSEVQS